MSYEYVFSRAVRVSVSTASPSPLRDPDQHVAHHASSDKRLMVSASGGPE
jgi:hypothetical protein